MGQAIHNLMINAAESMPWGGTVSIRFENTIRDGGDGLLEPGRYIDISITDQGVGIPAENMDKIFAPYFSTKTMGSDKGTGLGLSISHSIVRKHGGEITVSSRPGVGSTFHVMLPASEASTAADQPSCQIPPTKRPQKPIVGKGKILVMDDEAMIRQLAGNMLKHLGYDVDFAKEGVETVRKYQAAMDTSAPFDAVILDLTIKGGMGGRETMQQLKAIDPAVKAVVSSGYSDDPVIANYEQYGFCEAVGKPYEMVEFSQTLHRVTNDH
jgi:CheY-like chemotaxis protein/anti-sigma regulatory factor (Ser/Thr protein kinase)